MPTATKSKRPRPINRFPNTLRIEAYKAALARGLHLVRDNHHLWAIRASDNWHVHICSSDSYDGLWREACNTFADPAFDPEELPYAIADTERSVKIYDPRTGEEHLIPKKDLRSTRGD